MPYNSARKAARDKLRSTLEGINKVKAEAIGKTPTKGYTNVGGSGPENPRTLDAAKNNPDIYTKKFVTEDPQKALRASYNAKARTVSGDRIVLDSIENTYREMKKRDQELKEKQAKGKK